MTSPGGGPEPTAGVSWRARILRTLRARRRGRSSDGELDGLHRLRSRAERRARLRNLLWAPTYERSAVAEVPVEWLGRKGSAEGSAVAVYVHGGGFSRGSLNVYRSVVGRLARDCGLRTVSIGYRLAPENPFPAALSDVVGVYSLLAREHPRRPMVLAGDSAGAALALAASLDLVARGIRPPSATVLMGPWVDLTPEACAVPTIPGELTSEDLARWSRWYLQGADAEDPRVSPARADLAGTPPLLVVSSELDPLRAQASSLVERARAQGVSCRLCVYGGVGHGFQNLAPLLPEASAALRHSASFLRQWAAAPYDVPSS